MEDRAIANPPADPPKAASLEPMTATVARHRPYRMVEQNIPSTRFQTEFAFSPICPFVKPLLDESQYSPSQTIQSDLSNPAAHG